jgi:hypothetical protein
MHHFARRAKIAGHRVLLLPCGVVQRIRPGVKREHGEHVNDQSEKLAFCVKASGTVQPASGQKDAICAPFRCKNRAFRPKTRHTYIQRHVFIIHLGMNNEAKSPSPLYLGVSMVQECHGNFLKFYHENVKRENVAYMRVFARLVKFIVHKILKNCQLGFFVKKILSCFGVQFDRRHASSPSCWQGLFLPRGGRKREHRGIFRPRKTAKRSGGVGAKQASMSTTTRRGKNSSRCC